ncbi:class II aaRS and biotin synthetase [Aspergillus steynii IBT 23096]|uniref:proline--tRNA ligase n=1 Tax=Aspergillus steynii IBT 23096 TaxID=1392250 RepID=A0A2I2GI84_9EURO|nr:class II aaRS and biotin synthetase [Aspergillus steynii IBT 23096]PLB52590.1 class II aaRS and biotin synthetase [Aspergillus steynii IBT 23096]
MACRKTVIATPLRQIDLPKDGDFWAWYRETLEKADMIDPSLAAEGHFVLRPALCVIWERVQASLYKQLQLMGVQNCVFPILTPKITDTSDEYNEHHTRNLVADQLTTSSIIYSHFTRWIQTRLDLPLRLNQWKLVTCDVSHPEPLFRSREILMQEAHTAHLTELDASGEQKQVLDMYADLYEGLLAVPVVKGYRAYINSSHTSSALDGADVHESTMIAYVPALDQCVDGGSCRALGQSVSRKYRIIASDRTVNPNEDASSGVHVWQNSWCFSNRALGIMLAIHGDDEGIVVPPRVAENQVILIPSGSPHREQEWQTLLAEIQSIDTALSALDLRAHADLNGSLTFGWKLREWTIRGAPLCIMLGTKELLGQYARVYRRDLPKQMRRSDIPLAELPATIPRLLEEIQGNLLQTARSIFSSRQRQVINWHELTHYLCDSKEMSMCLAPHCLTEGCARQIETLLARPDHDRTTGNRNITCLCIPWSQPVATDTGLGKCINSCCASGAKKWAMFGPRFE